MKRISVVLLAVCCIFFSCDPAKQLARKNKQAKNNELKDTVQHITLDTLTVTAKAGKRPYRAAQNHVWDIKHTKVALSFNYIEKTADCHEWIRLHPFFYPTDTLVLDAKSMKVNDVSLVTGDIKSPLNFVYKDDQIKITFPHIYRAKDTIELYLDYVAMPYSVVSGGSLAISDDRGLYFINTDNAVPNKPAQIWTQGETESNSHWMPTIDRPNTRFTVETELTVPDMYQTLGNGKLVSSVKGKNGMRVDHWVMDKPIQAYAVMFAIGKYSIIKDSWKGMDVNYYVEPEYAPYAKSMFKNTPEMIGYFSERTGVSYPWNKYDQVVVRDYVSGAMENTTASLFGEFMNQNEREIADRDNEDIVSHELFHMWFGDYVTCESWSNLTVNESFANYGEQLWRAHKYGKASGDKLAYEDLAGYNGSSTISDPALVRFNYDSREEMFDAISYNKGGATLRYLNTLMGDEAFDKAMKIYLTKNALQSAEAHSWRMAVEEATGQDWNWFFNEYYFHGGHPVVKVIYNYNDSAQTLTVNVNQVQSDSTYIYTLPLKAAVIYGNDKTVVDWNLQNKNETFTYAYKNGQKPVIVPDCEHVLVGELRDGKKPAQWLVQINSMDDYISKRLALLASGKLLSDSSSQEVINAGLKDRLPTIKEYALGQLEATKNDKYINKWKETVLYMAQNDDTRLVRASAFRVLGSWKVKEAKPMMVAALNDNSYAIAGAALEGINKMDKDTAYVLAKQLLDKDPQAGLQASIWNIIGKKAADEDVVIFEHRAAYIYGGKKFSFVTSLNAYLKDVKSDASFERAAGLYEGIIKGEQIKGYRMGLAGSLYQVAGEYKDKSKAEDKAIAAAAQKRLDMIKAVIKKVTDAEHDTEVLDEYKRLDKSTFE